MTLQTIRRAATTLGAAAVLALATVTAAGLPVSATTAHAAPLDQVIVQYGPHHGHHGHHGWGSPGRARFWGHGYHRQYPTAYVVYNYEPVNTCSLYYLDGGIWYCYVGEFIPD
jgi:hypothetical protein